MRSSYEKIFTLGLICLFFINVGVLVLPSSPIDRGDIECISAYDFLIIGPDEFDDAIGAFVEHKQGKGITTIAISTEEIYQGYQGRDDAEKIKTYIKEMHENHDISYVLLLGGRKGQSFNWFVPVRYVHLDDGTGTYTSYFTDLYFADLYKEDGSFEDWDSNDNDLFGEFTPFNGDNLDLNPDISVGRIPCRTKKEAESIIEKIISYENTAYGSSWFHTAVMVGGDTFPNAEGYEGEQVCDYASQFLQDFSIEKLYATTGAITTSTDLVSAINAGCGFVFTRAKGGQDRVRVVTSDNEEIIALHNRDISSLSYDERYPIMILGECIHAKFDVTILNIFHYLFGHPNYFRSDCLFDCIAGKLVHKEHGGAIAVLTNVNLCYGSNGDENQNEIPDDAENYGGFLAVEALRIYIEEQKNILGDVFLQTQQEYVDTFPVHSDKNECKSIQDWILIGDPTLKIGGYPSS